MRPDLYGHIPRYIERHGLEAAAELAEFEIAHVSAIKKIVEKEKIDCDFTVTRTTDVWCNDAAAEKAKGVYDKMVAHGLKYMEDVDFTMGKDAPGVCADHVCERRGATADTLLGQWHQRRQSLCNVHRGYYVSVQVHSPFDRPIEQTWSQHSDLHTGQLIETRS